MSGPRLPFSLGTVVLGGGALLLGGFLLVGFLLAGTWEVTRSRRLAAPPAAVFPHLDGPAAWRDWTALPDTGLTMEGPARGAGASMSWNHPEWGSGSFEIVAADPPDSVRYTVLVEDGAMRTDGRLHLVAEADGTRLTWSESGDFGWNPLMGYWSLFMERAQGRELDKSLDRLEALLAAEAADGSARRDSVAEVTLQEPADSLTGGS